MKKKARTSRREAARPLRVQAHDNRNEPHFDHLRNYHPTTITESRKFRKPKHKKSWMDDADE